MRKLICLLTLVFFLTISYGVYAQKEDRSLNTQVVTQIGLVVEDIEKTSKAYADLFGIETPQVSETDEYSKTNAHYKGEPTNARAKLAFIRLENITIEIIEPIGGPSTWQEFLDKHGEGVHHIAFQVEDMDETIAMLETKGGELVQRGDFTGGSYSYVESQEKLKTIIELLTSDD
ncbi:MAG: VOC family protein [Bacteroidales bacterium]|nr:VOC family protein [Bacteroidales bacterium]MBS3777312.1 VOC family protein [Bacteroidales bacterium]